MIDGVGGAVTSSRFYTFEDISPHNKIGCLVWNKFWSDLSCNNHTQFPVRLFLQIKSQILPVWNFNFGSSNTILVYTSYFSSSFKLYIVMREFCDYLTQNTFSTIERNIIPLLSARIILEISGHKSKCSLVRDHFS